MRITFTSFYYSLFFKSLKALFFISLVYFIAPLDAQDLGAIGRDKKPFKIKGSASASQIFYAADGIENRRNPYNYFLSGNLNLSLYGWTVPLTYTFSNQQSQFQQPFNQYGATPYYKWIKFYVGYTSMSFSSYTMNGYIFLGGGIQLTPPGLFRLSAMYGRLNRAVEEDTSNTSVIPFYQRMGGGFKVGIGKNSDGIDFIFFAAKDDPNSLKRPILRSPIAPAENIVMSLIATKSLMKRVMVSGEYAISGVTNDIRSSKNDDNGNFLFSHIPFYSVKSSTSFYSAFKANINYSGEGYSIGVGYERIDPGYKTFGAYYFNDDLENYVVNGSKRFLNGKLNISSNIGIQNNNLRGDKISKMSRYVFGGSMSYTASQRLSFNASYSNFQTYTRVKTLSQLENSNLPQQLNGNPDTLNFAQLSQSANLGTSYALTSPASKTMKNTLNINLVYQTSGDARSNQAVNFGTRFYNGTFSYNRSLIPQALNMTFAFNSNLNEYSNIRTILIGPSVSISKSFFQKKLKTTAATAYTNSISGGKTASEILNFRLNCSYVILKKHSLNLNTTIIHRNSAGTSTKAGLSFTEYTANMGYSYSF